ncbi:hypothetical protein N7G274_004189 [Stereocaulon virgatum]|uniref:tRNA-splicing endonuclease subunit Sen15 domain-containing protein n=1 Tax=Stereocaulon virgatum TaxID=373712 RepID=A0ABR4AEI2_9LECA
MAVDTTLIAPQPSALDSYLKSHGLEESHSPHYQTLASQILHNLQYQHDWTSLRIHTHSALVQKALPRPLISGLPPHRIYVHPDDQVEELKRGADLTKGEPEREWVLPTHLAEKWSLRRFGEVFDAIEEEPFGEHSGKREDEDVERKTMAKKRRGGKRLLLATLGDDSTVVYYVVHDGIVKPRQN